MKRRAQEWVAMGRPDVDQLRIEAHPSGMAAERPGRWLIRGEWSDLLVGFGGV
jgi:hypothetical protein